MSGLQPASGSPRLSFLLFPVDGPLFHPSLEFRIRYGSEGIATAQTINYILTRHSLSMSYNAITDNFSVIETAERAWGVNQIGFILFAEGHYVGWQPRVLERSSLSGRIQIALVSLSSNSDSYDDLPELMPPPPQEEKEEKEIDLRFIGMRMTPSPHPAAPDPQSSEENPPHNII